MHLSPSQADRFYELMDSLLFYVNDRFSVVEGFDALSTDPMAETKVNLVARELWGNPPVIDAFIDDRRSRLTSGDIDTLRSWKYAVQGPFDLVRYESGRALLMNDVGVFAVCGLDNDPVDELGPAPALVEMTLLPFEGMIVHDGLLTGYDVDPNSRQARAIQDMFDTQGARGVVRDSAGFIEVARAYHDAQAEQAMRTFIDSLDSLGDAGEEQLPDGYHRGALCGIEGKERLAAIDEHFRNSDYFESFVEHFRSFAHPAKAVYGYPEILALNTKDRLVQVARVLEVKGASRMRKDDLASAVAKAIVASSPMLDAYLSDCSTQEFDALRKLIAGERIRVSESDLGPASIPPLTPPYLFLFRDEDEYEVVLPRELAQAIASRDLDAIESARLVDDEAFNCAVAAVTYCGILSMDEAYALYADAVDIPLAKRDFIALLEDEAESGDSMVGVWRDGAQEYVVHFSISEDYSMERAMRGVGDPQGLAARAWSDAEASSLDVYQAIVDEVADEMEALGKVRAFLIQEHQRIGARPIDRACVEGDAMDVLMGLPSVLALRNFFDEHVPDSQDDYAYPDQMTASIVAASIEGGSLPDVFQICFDAGIENCCLESDRLPKLITNVFNSMPSWENNGWSPTELQEKMTGRKLFYNENGDVMKLGANDPCPCGSGKEYGRCCGRGRAKK